MVARGPVDIGFGVVRDTVVDKVIYLLFDQGLVEVIINNIMRYRYSPDPEKKKKLKPNNKPGRFSEPHKWVTGPDPLRHEKYYAWLKHKSQANYRNEAYELTWADWEIIWQNDADWFGRGRGSNDLSLVKVDRDQPWRLDNVQLMRRIDYLTMPKRKREGQVQDE